MELFVAKDGQSAQAAERYAAAALELAEEQTAVEALERDLSSFSEALTESADLALVAASPLITPEEKSRGLVAVADRLGLSPLGRNLIGVAALNGRAGDLRAIAQAYRRLLAEKRGEQAVEIVSAAPLEPKQLAALVDSLAKTLGRKVQPEVRVDDRLIGGFIVRAGSRQFDASVKTKLDNLRLALRAG
ncbi:MAG: ATP synthase F1 subunit delta [Hyphomonadaceae bacterium]